MNRTIVEISAVVIGLGMLALAAVPSYGQNNTIYACITKPTGQIRIVSAPGQCKSNEASISWNNVGPQGPQGIQGPPGVPLGVCPDSDKKTYLLFPFGSSQGGLDSAIVISNTGKDPWGQHGNNSTCVLSFYGDNPPSDFTSPTISQGTSFVMLFSNEAPNFAGYVIANCDFPFAHGWSWLTDLGVQKVAAAYLPINICNPRVPPQ